MNNSRCVAHHEGFDFHLFDQGNGWLTSHASAWHRQASDQGKNYFCCDISVTSPLVANYGDWVIANPVFREEMKPRFIFISTHTKQCIDSFERMNCCMPGVKSGIKNHRQTLDQFFKQIQKMSYEYIVIDKEREGERVNGSLFFSKSQLTEIAQFCGAYDPLDQIENKRMNYLRQCNISLTPELLRESMEEVKKYFPLSV